MITMLLVSVLLGGLGACAVSMYGHRLKLTDRPNERSSHTIPTPKGGGIGIAVSFVLCSVYYSVSPFLWLPALILSLVSFSGDFVNISRCLRLFIQIAASVTCISFSYPPESIIVLLLWAVFIAGTANFYNFMDGINGIAGITAVCASILVYIRTAASGMTPDVCQSVFFAVGAACAGFLPFNIPCARVFMGDVGSILTGFWFGFLVFFTSSTRPSDSAVLPAMILFMLPFYADAVGTIIVRISRRENIAEPHRSHIYQILANNAGIEHWKVSLGYGIVQLFTGLAFIFSEKFIGIKAALLTAGLFLSVYIVVFCIVRIRFEEKFRI